MNEQIKQFQNYLETTIVELENYRTFAQELGCSELTIETLVKAISISSNLSILVENGDIKINYLNQFRAHLDAILSTFSYRDQKDFSFVQHQGEQWIFDNKNNVDLNSIQVSNNINQIEFNLDFFEKIGFFSNNIVAIGANGSGKTSLSNKFKGFLQNNGVVISAQRVLLIPNFDSITNPTKTTNDLRQAQKRDKTNKNPSEYNHLSQEFGLVLKNLLAENISVGNQYRRDCINKTGEDLPPPITNLDRTLEIWNNLIAHRKIDCDDGMNISVKYDSVTPYPAVQMSDGEKVMLYLIGQVLQAPENGFIVIDEPEMYLHKTILKKLWDNLEKQRQDCLFVYLTHDLDFATSRTNAKKIWIKEFIYPDKWDIETIPENEIPETLLFELLGSRKDILFCEGKRGSIDEKIYNILFPEYTITPVGNCFQVINHTKAFNKLESVQTKAIGLVDSDHHGADRLDSIKKEGIYSFDIVEPENLLLDESFLKKLATKIMKGDAEVNAIKSDIISELEKEKKLQASNFVSAKIDYYFKDSNLRKGNDLETVKQNYIDFTKEVSIEDWYNNRMAEIDKIIAEDDYRKVLSIFNHKGLRGKANKQFKISDFTERAIELLQYDSTTHEDLLKYFPEEIK